MYEVEKCFDEDVVMRVNLIVPIYHCVSGVTSETLT